MHVFLIKASLSSGVFLRVAAAAQWEHLFVERKKFEKTNYPKNKFGLPHPILSLPIENGTVCPLATSEAGATGGQIDSSNNKMVEA
jgi:hypothetical protein